MTMQQGTYSSSGNKEGLQAVVTTYTVDNLQIATVAEAANIAQVRTQHLVLPEWAAPSLATLSSTRT